MHLMTRTTGGGSGGEQALLRLRSSRAILLRPNTASPPTIALVRADADCDKLGRWKRLSGTS